MSKLDKQHARYMETGSEIFVQAIRIDLRKEWVGLFKLDLFSTVMFHRPARACDVHMPEILLAVKFSSLFAPA